MLTAARLIIILVIVVACVECRSRADEVRIAELYGGYSLLHGDLQKSAGGWELSAGVNVKQWVSFHASFDAHHQSDAHSLRHEHDLLFGPQFSHRSNNFTVFAHSLAGICRATGIKSDSGFAYVAGGGLDVDFGAVSLRLAQIGFHNADVFGRYQHQLRFSAGIVLRVVGFSDRPRRRIPPRPPDQPQPEKTPAR